MDEQLNHKILIVRALTRAAAFLVPLITLCGALFFIPALQDMICGAVIGAATTASVFYFKKEEV